ncbi:MAG: HAMP domain-containing sensor histidine kinase [Pseudomonadota bacterium]
MIQRALPDKTIVDRSGPAHNAELRKAISSTRRKLTDNEHADPLLTNSMLTQHVQGIRTACIVFPSVIAVAAAVALQTGFGFDSLLWALIGFCVYAALWLSTRHVDTRDDEDPSTLRKWTAWFYAGHGLAAIIWLVWVTLPCEACAPSDAILLKTLVLMVATAATGTICFSMRWANFASLGLPTALLVLLYGPNASNSEQLLLAVLVIALVFFTLVSSRLRSASKEQASIRYRNSALIAELEVEKTNSEGARQRAEEANLAKSRFLASMSHELRTPLNAILGFSEIMKDEMMGPLGSPQYTEYAGNIHQSGDHLLKIINEILDLSRIEAGKYEMHPEPLSLSQIAEECASLVRLRAQKKSISLRVDAEPNLPLVEADAKAMRQLVLNLLSNAIKSTPQKGEVTVAIGWTSSGGQYVQVRDTGPGIPEDEISVVLSAFGQGSIAIKSAEQGTGLGLPIVQALVELHGGKFRLESELRKGTTAIALLPPHRTLQSTVVHKPVSAATDDHRDAA